MRAVLCDVCGKKLSKWYEVKVVASAMSSMTNMSEMTCSGDKYEICKECFEKIKRESEQR